MDADAAEDRAPAFDDGREASAPQRRGRIVTAEDLRARQRKREIERDAAQIFEEAKAAGYAAGREAAAAEAVQNLAALKLDTDRWRRSIEAEMIEVVMRAVTRVIGEIDDLELVQRVTAAAVAELRDVGRIALHVAPADQRAVREHLSVLTQAFPGVEIVDVVADPTVGRGGAVLKSALGSIDARIETQLTGLRAALSAAFAPADDDED